MAPAQAVQLDLSEFEGLVPEEVFGRTAFPPIGTLPYLLTLSPRGFFWFLLTEAKHLPGRLFQSSPPPKNTAGHGRYSVVDLNLSRYDRLAARYAREQREGVVALKSGIDTRNAAFNALIERLESGTR